MVKAVLRLPKPDEQKPLGNDVPLSYPAVTDADHSWPPLSHSHVILSLLSSKLYCQGYSLADENDSYPRRSSKIMMIARMAEITTMKGHRNLQALVQMYDRWWPKWAIWSGMAE